MNPPAFCTFCGASMRPIQDSHARDHSIYTYTCENYAECGYGTGDVVHDDDGLTYNGHAKSNYQKTIPASQTAD